MNDSDLSPISFTKEKSLWQIYVQSRKIPTSKFNLITTSIVFMVAMTSWLSDQDTAETIRSVRDMSSTCFNASLTILGFLVAGFTIFATLTNARMFIQMGQIRERETNSGLTYLKKSFFILIRVFIYYLLFSVACFFILALGGRGGFVSFIVTLSEHQENVRFAIAKMAYVFIITAQYFLLMQLKSFIFNIHHSVMSNLRWQAEGHDH